MEKKSKGLFTEFLAGLSLLVISIIFFTDSSSFFGGVKVFLEFALIVSGVIYSVCYSFNSKSYFKPGWILTQGFVQIFISVYLFFITDDFLTDEYLSFIIGFWGIVTSATQISSSIQLKVMDIKKWWTIFISGLIILVVGFSVLINPFENEFITSFLRAVTILLIAMSTICDTFFRWRNIN